MKNPRRAERKAKRRSLKRHVRLRLDYSDGIARYISSEFVKKTIGSVIGTVSMMLTATERHIMEIGERLNTHPFAPGGFKLTYPEDQYIGIANTLPNA